MTIAKTPASQPMNRIHNLIDDELETFLTSTEGAIDTTPEPSDERDQSHCIFTPLHYGRNYADRLVVWLQGQEGDDSQWTRVMPLVSTRNYAAVGPRGTRRSEGSAGGYRWAQETRHIALAEERVGAAIAA